MRLLLTTDAVGGVWTFTRELTVGLIERGHAVALASLGREPSPSQRLWCDSMEAVHGDSFRYVSSPAPLEWMESNESAYRVGAALLSDLVESFVPDLLHSSQFCFGALPVALPRVITAHSDVLSWAAACRPGGLPPSAWLRRYRGLVQRGLDGADAVVAPSGSMRDALCSHFSVTPRAIVISNGRTLSPPAGRAVRSLQAVSAGRLWDEAKAVDTLLAVDTSMPLLIAGEEPLRGIRSPGFRSIHRKPVRMLGRLEEEEVLHLFRQSSVYLAASIYEPFGLAPLEAALCGCALVVRDLPSLREVWDDAALYFRSLQDLQRALHRLATEPEFLEQRQGAALLRAAKFSRARMADRYLSLYRKLLEPAVLPAAECALHAA